MAQAFDDDVFGEFTFASNSNPQLNEENDDDEWSDFVNSPQQQSSAAWIKPSGALPLSIFGEEDGEEDNSNHFLRSDNGGVSSDSRVVSSIPVDSGDNHLNRNGSVNLNDLTGGIDHIQFEKNKSGNGGFDASWNGISGKTSTVEVSSKDLKLDGAKRPVEIDVDDEWDFKGGNMYLMNQNVEKSSQKSVAEDEKRQSGDDYNDDHDDNDDDDDDDGWEFKAANTDFPGKGVNGYDVEITAYQGFTMNEASFQNKAVGNTNGSVDIIGTYDLPFDFFAKTGDTSSSPSKQQDLIPTLPSTAVINGFASDADKKIEIDNGWDHNVDISADYDDDFGDFTSASADNGPKREVTPMVDELSPSKDALSIPAGQLLGNDNMSNHNGPLQLSIFGVDEPENGSVSDIQDAFSNEFKYDPRNSHTSTKAVSINDLISSLYSQTGETLAKTQSSISNGISDSTLANDSDYVDNDSWEFKDAVPTRFDSMAPSESTIDENTTKPSKLKLINYLDFYLKLKGELYAVTKYHIEMLKDSNASASHENVGFTKLDDKLQLMCKELEQMNLELQESKPPVHTSGDSFASDLVEVLKEPQFQKLESEYHLSQKLLVVDKDLNSSMELLRHANTMSRILTVATTDEQMAYITTWHSIISVCAKELKHGVSIWNQAVEKHIQNLLLSEPQGTRFVLALGEIYRVIVVLEASAKLFKLWILTGSTKLPDIYGVLNECHAVWSTSGLEEALSTVSISSSLDGALLSKSIEHIKNLDAIALQELVFAQNCSLCQISGLSAAVVPGMKMITWGKDQYFVTLANLWANLITRDPPNLRKLNYGLVI